MEYVQKFSNNFIVATRNLNIMSKSNVLRERILSSTSYQNILWLIDI